MGCMKVDNRVEFPLEGLDMTPYLAGPLQQGGEQFQLYATVNHSGGPSGGHYTSYAAHPVTNTWHLFNDNEVTKVNFQTFYCREGEKDLSHCLQEAPVSEKQNLAYVLFYKRTGCEYDMDMPDKGNQTQVAMEETI